MFKDLGLSALKNGRPMSVGRIDAPCAAWRPRLLELLKHKGDEWREHLGLALESPLDELESHFYIGSLMGEDGGDFMCHIMVAESRGVGLLGHVYTQPEHRQKGAIRALMSMVMDDCRSRGVRVISLNTVYDSPAYHIYQSFGFTSVVPGGGSMIREFEASVVDTMLATSTARVRPLTWDDWPALNLLSVLPEAAAGSLREPMEGSFIRHQLARLTNKRISGVALVNADGDTVGWSTVAPVNRVVDASDSQEGGVDWVLDACAAPNFIRYYPDIIRALALPDVPIKATCAHGPKANELTRVGFVEGGPVGDKAPHVFTYVRRP